MVNDLGIDWKFNLFWVLWWGGFFEWMVWCIKGCLKKIFGFVRLIYEELFIVFIEVEGVLNLRFFIYVYGDDIEELLIFFYLMIGRRLLFRNLNIVLGGGFCVSSVIEIVRRVKYLKLFLDYFWNRW